MIYTALAHERCAVKITHVILTVLRECCDSGAVERVQDCLLHDGLTDAYNNVHMVRMYTPAPAFIIDLHAATRGDVRHRTAPHVAAAQRTGSAVKLERTFKGFYRATLCSSAVLAVDVCTSVCPSVSLSVCHTPVLCQNG